MVRQPELPSPARVVGLVRSVAEIAGLVRVSPVAIRVQVLPPSALFKKAAVAFENTEVLAGGMRAAVSWAALASAYSTVVPGSAAGAAAKLIRPMSVRKLPVTAAGRPPAARIEVQVAPPSVLFQKSPMLKTPSGCPGQLKLPAWME